MRKVGAWGNLVGREIAFAAPDMLAATVIPVPWELVRDCVPSEYGLSFE
jgi:hypothetical protein